MKAKEKILKKFLPLIIWFQEKKKENFQNLSSTFPLVFLQLNPSNFPLN